MHSHHPILIALAIAAAMAAAARSQERRMPLDPLTPEELELAARISDADARVHEAIGGANRRIYTEFIAVKNPPTRPPLPPVKGEVPPAGRFAEVLYIRYDTNVGVRVLVDLEAKRVVDVASASGRSVPINADEVDAAARLALSDARVTRLLGPQAETFRVAHGPAMGDEAKANRIEGLRTLGATPADPCYEHRCIVLFFRQANRYIHLNEVTVDLTAKKVSLRGGAK
jgi:hypothetical protein